jgi:Pyridoxamine 5'-phosphate oxidase
MGAVYESISPELAAWISQQKMFFVATAPLSSDGHVNLSPKGGESFKVISPLEVVYQDYTGSGAETAAHIQENGRIVIMFCAFSGPPKIVRLHGLGALITRRNQRFAEFSGMFPANVGTRAFVHVSVQRVSDSCGYSVPFFEYQGPRDALDRWASNKGSDQLEQYRAAKNQKSIDGLSAFDLNA